MKPIAIALLATFVVACKDDPPPPLPLPVRTSTSASAAAVVSAAPTGFAAASDRARALYESMKGMRLSDALTTARSELQEQTGQMSIGSGALARWAIDSVRWDDIMGIPETTRGEAFKDIVMNRGRRVCATGGVTEIAVDRRVAPVITWATMSAGPDALTLLVGGSARGIVRGSRARFCGVTTELNTYQTTGGGTATSLVLVGMFDLPENKTKGPGK